MNDIEERHVMLVGRLWDAGQNTFEIGRTLNLPEEHVLDLVGEHRNRKRLRCSRAADPASQVIA